MLRIEDGWGWSAAALSLAGLGLATYLSVAHVSGSGPACQVGGSCGEVTGSEYSALLGVPVAFIGVAGYGALLLGSLAQVGLDEPPAGLAYGLLGTALAGWGFSAYLVFTQAFLMGAYCSYCMASAAIMTATLGATAGLALSRRSVRIRTFGIMR